jgi:hypothetical protein
MHPLAFLFSSLLFSMCHSLFNEHFSFCPFMLLHSPYFFTQALLHLCNNNNNLFSSLYLVLIAYVHLVHTLYAMVLHALHVECFACSSLQLFSFSGCSFHFSNIIGCYNQIPSPHYQLIFFIFCCNRAQLLCCSFRVQRSSSCQSPPWTVFVQLADPLRLFTFSVNHTGVSSSPLVETINGFKQLHYEDQH